MKSKKIFRCARAGVFALGVLPAAQLACSAGAAGDVTVLELAAPPLIGEVEQGLAAGVINAVAGGGFLQADGVTPIKFRIVETYFGTTTDPVALAQAVVDMHANAVSTNILDTDVTRLRALGNALRAHGLTWFFNPDNAVARAANGVMTRAFKSSLGVPPARWRQLLQTNSALGK